MLLLLLLIQCKISLYLGPVRCFVTPVNTCQVLDEDLQVQQHLVSYLPSYLNHYRHTPRRRVLVAAATIVRLTDELKFSS